jgi:5-methyltetrahydrofolate--homocysteine methyltransferase
MAYINDRGIPESLSSMIGGGPVDEEVRRYSGADAYGEDAVAAVKLSKKRTGSK